MTYLDLAAEEIRRHVPEKALPDGDTELLFRLYAVLLLAKGADVTTADVHNAWSAWMQTTHPDHQSLRPFEELDPKRDNNYGASASFVLRPMLPCARQVAQRSLREVGGARIRGSWYLLR